MIKSFLKKLSVVILSVLFLVPSSAVLAQTGTKAAPAKPSEVQKEILNTAQKTAQGAGYKKADDLTIVRTLGSLVQVLLGLIGMLFMILTIFAGVQYMTAGGDSGQVDKALATIKNGIIGMGIVFLAYAITYFVQDFFRQNQAAQLPEKKSSVIEYVIKNV